MMVLDENGECKEQEGTNEGEEIADELDVEVSSSDERHDAAS